MSTAYKCDRCGVFFEGKDIVSLDAPYEYIRAKDGHALGTWRLQLQRGDSDLCGACQEESLLSGLRTWEEFAKSLGKVRS